ncbi:MAG: aspartate/glutamate racemase family protein [Ilumatobacteraceae bacterium]
MSRSPQPTIGFLHTSPVHTATFDRLVDEFGADVVTATVVNAALLADARRLGPRHPDVSEGIALALDELALSGADVVVCTCSTIGAEAERLGHERGQRVIRVDRPMADAAVAMGRRIAVVAAVDSTVGPTLELIESVSAGRDVDVSVVLSEGAWARFEAGDLDGYLDTVAATCASLAGTVDVIVLAQASMADAALRLNIDTPILSSPRLAVCEAARLISPSIVRHD